MTGTQQITHEDFCKYIYNLSMETENKPDTPNLSPGSISTVNKILEEQNTDKLDSTDESDEDDVNNVECEKSAKQDVMEDNPPKSSHSSTGLSNNNVAFLLTYTLILANENEDKKAEKADSNKENKDKERMYDPRMYDNKFFLVLIIPSIGDVEIQLLKARLEQTEAALERIVAHMGSVTARLARNGVFMDEEVGSAVSGSLSL